MKIFDNSDENKKYYEKLVEFVEAQEKKPYPHILKDVIRQIVIEELIDEKAEITGYCKDDSLGTAYIELTWRYDND